MKGIKIQVSCYAGHTAHERPVNFDLGGKKFSITAILDQWYGPDHLYFKVIADDGNEYILRYDESTDGWELDFFRKTN